ncbi:rhodanese-like domain-containing protein [Paenimyroides tangerinum]|uniref:Rhodanese-like domain-containing protein n=1 Tax=Paenimyroides tangerinum TaxID=2488728 RepID=A0A3P3W3H7_9FLAO|nr:rhodanese-like domain-containing protein [Paenimyroides tangerinum]RRJ89294.1 rhodanese-like domain-containing protein [Paenimyroides tangerinum]
MKKVFFFTICCLATTLMYSQNIKKSEDLSKEIEYPKALIDYEDFKNLVTEVETHRANRLINLDKFLEMSKKQNVVILDTRSDYRFERKHLKGAIHLDFTDFTQENLQKLVPDTNTIILIYCNNNFKGDQIDFATKMYKPNNGPETQILSNRKPIMLALNIPTYINLYGYGYKNIYELDELVDVNDSRIQFEGTEFNKALSFF